MKNKFKEKFSHKYKLFLMKVIKIKYLYLLLFFIFENKCSEHGYFNQRILENGKIKYKFKRYV